MNNISILENSIGIIVIAILAIIVIIQILKDRKEKNTVENFLNGLHETIIVAITEIIDEANPETFKDFSDFEKTTLEVVYRNVYIYVKSQAEEAFDTDPLMKVVLNKLSMDMIKELADKIILACGLDDTIRDKYNNKSNAECEVEDKELQDKFADQEEYIENSDEVELNSGDAEAPTEEELAELNPQKDEENESFDPEDDSMELLPEDNKPVIVTALDKNGNKLYYEIGADGKKKRVSKEYAISNLV